MATAQSGTHASLDFLFYETFPLIIISSPYIKEFTTAMTIDCSFFACKLPTTNFISNWTPPFILHFHSFFRTILS